MCRNKSSVAPPTIILGPCLARSSVAPPTHHLIRTLLGGLLQLHESGDPAILLRFILCQDEHLALEPDTALLVARDLEDGRNELGASMDDIV